MKHIPYFQQFLSNEVDLNKTRLDRLINSSSAVDTFLSSNLDAYEKTERQGSYGLKTIIKPVGTLEYDADQLLYMTHDEAKEPKDYINDVYNCLRENDNYKDKVQRKTRCVNIDYAGEFHLDIVPCITQQDSFTQKKEYFICNNKENEFETTDGTGYRDWFNEKTGITHGNLKRVTRLLKFLRDHKRNFSVKSILLTTLIGNSVDTSDEGSDDFKNIPTALKTVSNRINSFLQANVLMPEICNPVLDGESFTRHWDQDKYNHFREMFDLYNSKINEAFEETAHDASVRKWRKLFGDNFGELSGGTQNNGNAPAAVTSASVEVTPIKPYAR